MKLPQLPPRSVNSHKGDFGRALLVGGSRGMSGAIGLAGMATLRSGAGLVTLATPSVCLDTVASFEPSYMTVPLECDEQGRIAATALDELKSLCAARTCIACGPGLGQSPGLTVLVSELYSAIEQPMVFDADALNALAASTNGLPSAGGPRVLTPHPGEFARLLGERVAIEDMPQRAVEYARQHQVILLLKGHRTLVTDGEREAINETGNPGMATGGSGDVLTGIITALICQGLEAFEAAQLGAYVHGLAGDLAAEQLGQVSLIASDLIRSLPQALLQFAD